MQHCGKPQLAETEQVRQGTPRVGRPSVKQLIRERCSFHLLSPMMESYFFGDRAALRRSGCTLRGSPMLRDTNWEDFWCCDPDSKQRISARNHEMRVVHNLPFWEEERHAKHYLEDLIARSGGTPYEETVGGAAALRQLDWPRVLGGSPTHCPLAKALMDDLSAFFQRPSPLPPRAPSAVSAAKPAKPGSRQVLRNM